MVARAYTVETLNNLMMPLAMKMFEEEYALIIVDSIMAPFRVDYLGRGELCKKLLLIIFSWKAECFREDFKSLNETRWTV